MHTRRWLWVVLICLAVTALLLAWHFTRPDPLAEEVDRLVASMATRGAQATIDDLWALGPRVIPHLARNARKHNTILFKAYRFARAKLPKPMQTWLKAPPDRDPIRAAAMEAIINLGPLAAWGAAPAVVEGMIDPVQN